MLCPMALSPQKFREIVFLALYSRDFTGAQEDEVVEMIMKELTVTKKSVREALEKVSSIEAKRSEIDEMISSSTLSYDFDRIPHSERNILRLGVYELFFAKGIPPKVAIAEGIRLARKFSTPESAHFVNAILDNLYKSKSEASTILVNAL